MQKFILTKSMKVLIWIHDKNMWQTRKTMYLNTITYLTFLHDFFTPLIVIQTAHNFTKKVIH